MIDNQAKTFTNKVQFQHWFDDVIEFYQGGTKVNEIVSRYNSVDNTIEFAVPHIDTRVALGIKLKNIPYIPNTSFLAGAKMVMNGTYITFNSYDETQGTIKILGAPRSASLDVWGKIYLKPLIHYTLQTIFIGFDVSLIKSMIIENSNIDGIYTSDEDFVMNTEVIQPLPVGSKITYHLNPEFFDDIEYLVRPSISGFVIKPDFPNQNLSFSQDDFEWNPDESALMNTRVFSPDEDITVEVTINQEIPIIFKGSIGAIEV